MQYNFDIINFAIAATINGRKWPLKNVHFAIIYSLMLFQTSIIDFLLWKKKEDILKNVWFCQYNESQCGSSVLVLDPTDLYYMEGCNN